MSLLLSNRPDDRGRARAGCLSPPFTAACSRHGGQNDDGPGALRRSMWFTGQAVRRRPSSFRPRPSGRVRAAARGVVRLDRSIRYALHRPPCGSPRANAMTTACRCEGRAGGWIRLRAALLQRGRRRPGGRSAGHGAQGLSRRGLTVTWDLRGDGTHCRRRAMDTGAATCMPPGEASREASELSRLPRRLFRLSQAASLAGSFRLA